MKQIKDILEGLLAGKDDIMSDGDNISNVIKDVAEMHELAKLTDDANAFKTSNDFNDAHGHPLEHGDIVLLCSNRTHYQGNSRIRFFSFGIVNRYLKSKSIEVICGIDIKSGGVG